MSYNFPWLKDTIQYDPYEEPDYPQPQESEIERPKYRTPTIDKSVRVYTVAQESRYLIIRNIPVTGVINELIQQLALYGVIEEYNYLTNEPSAPFTLSIWVRFQLVSVARQAKHKMNKSSFFGQDLWIQYAPEFESVEDVSAKLQSRQIAVKKRLEELVIERPDEMVHEYKKRGRIPVEKMTTSGLLGEEEAIPAGDFVNVKEKQQDKEVKAIEGMNLQPLHRKRGYDMNQKKSESIQSVSNQQNGYDMNQKKSESIQSVSYQQVGALREGEREVTHNAIELKVASVLDQIERKAEKSSQSPPPAKKRKRI